MIENNHIEKKYYWHFWMIFIIVFSLGTAFVVVRDHGNRQHDDRINTYLQNTASQLNIDGFEQVKQMLSGIAKQTFAVSTALGNKSPDNPEILAAMLSVSSALNASIVYLLDNKGTVVACTPYGNGKTLTGENYEFRPYFTNITGGGNSTFYAALGVTTDERGIYISIPVKEGEALSGVLVAKLDLAVVDRRLNSITSPVVMISPDGVVFATNKKEWLFKTVLPMTQLQRQSLRKTKQFATEELLPLGYDFSQAALTLGNKKYTLTSKPVMDGKWKLIGLFKPPALNTVEFGLVAFAIWSFIVLISFGCRFYFGLILSKKQLKDTVQQLNLENTERKQSELIIKIKSEELEAANEELIAVSEGLQAKKQSLLNEKLFAEALLECLPGYLYVYDDQGSLVRWNKKHETMTGYSAEELSQKNMSDWFEGEDAVRVAAAVDEVLTTGYGEVEGHLLIKGGEKMLIHSNGVRLTIDGKTYFVGVGIDITERKQAEINLKKSEARHGKMVANIGDVIVIIDKEGINTYKSPNIKKLFGWDPEDVVGSSAWDIVHPDDIESAQRVFGKILSKPEAVGTMECRYRCKDGSYKWIEFTGTNFLHDSDINGILGNYHDITERKKFESQVQQAQKMESIGNLAGGIAHDFNNLLYPIIGYAEMLKEDLPKDSPEHESAQEIFNAGKRGGELVKQILAFSRQVDHNLSPVRFQKILTEVFKLTRSLIPSDIEIHQDIQKDCGLVMAAETQLHQIAMNLITNAYHAVEKTSGKISVQLKEITLNNDDLKDSPLQAGQYVKLSVSDNGIGIPEEIINNIFDPYFTTKEQGKGTGLGLAVVYGILKEHKGDIKVYSEMGKGTTFNVYLPLLKEAADAISTETELNKLAGTERLLLVDDEESVVRLEKQMLERLGYNVSVRSNSLEALETFKSNPDGYDLVISDMTMPYMTGDQLARELMSIRPDIPIIICTGFSERINKEQAEANKVKGFLMKPVVKSEMAKMVRKVLDEAKIS